MKGWCRSLKWYYLSTMQATWYPQDCPKKDLSWTRESLSMASMQVNAWEGITSSHTSQSAFGAALYRGCCFSNRQCAQEHRRYSLDISIMISLTPFPNLWNVFYGFMIYRCSFVRGDAERSMLYACGIPWASDRPATQFLSGNCR